MAHGPRTPFKNPVIDWIDQRLPIFTMVQKEYGVFPTPKNFNYFWNFGAAAMVVLVTMILTGLFLAMNYTPNAGLAFDSVERIMRDVNYGWLIRYIHMNGASMFFIAVYIHIFRGLYYGSYKKPRELLWIFGVVILLLMMATGFMGYTLPWSQMSGWGATVITSLFSSIPLVGDPLVHFLWGGFSVDNPTLNRFFALHFLLPFVIVAVVFLHVWALHVTGSNNPTGIDPKGPQDTLPFHPYYTMKDTFGITIFLMVFAALVFFAPLQLTHPDHFVPFNPMVTPPHIVPEWYFLPFYAILRSITFDIAIPFTGITLIEAKLGGVLAMFGAIVALGALPWLDTHPVRSCRYRPLYRIALLVLVVDLCVLTWVGGQVAEQPYILISQLATAYYFAFFLVIAPVLSRVEKVRELPNSIHEAVLAQRAKRWFVSIALVFVVLTAAPAAHANEGAELPARDWTFASPLGTFDRGQLQRGYQVYKEVCSACHAMKRVYFRNLSMLGYTEDQIKTIAAEYTVMDGPNDAGEMFERPARPSDPFKSPFANDEAARAANNGAVPPDLSLLTRARQGGADYITAILTGYEAAPAGFTLNEGMNYNKYFTGHQIAMPAPLSAGQVTYADGTYASVEQMAKDVSTFMTFMSDLHQEQRKRMGVAVILFLMLFSGLMYGVKRTIWHDQH